MIAIDKNIAAVNARIQRACEQSSRDCNTVKLLAVSKKQPVSAIRSAVGEGIADFGENYLQEAETKIAELQEMSLKWHYIGAIQSNKTRAIASLFDWVHSVERASIAKRLSDQRPADRPPLNICLQINIDQELNKSGVAPDELLPLAHSIAGLPGLRLRGLMAIPAQGADSDTRRASFKRMRSLFDQLAERDSGVDTLSMGMSADLELAIEEGATLLRIGTDIFGPRGS